MRGTGPVAGVAVMAALAAAAPAAAQPKRVSGRTAQILNCLPTKYDPTTKAIDCDGSTLWDGSWTGVTHYHLRGTYDLFTGDGEGTLHETFVGLASDGDRGTLDFVGRFTIDGSTGTIHIDARLLSRSTR